MNLFKRRTKVSVDERLAVEIKRTGIDVELVWSTVMLCWYAWFPDSRWEIQGPTREAAARHALAVLRRAPDKDTSDYGD